MRALFADQLVSVRAAMQKPKCHRAPPYRRRDLPDAPRRTPKNADLATTRLQRLIDDGGEAQSQALRKGQMKKLKAFRKSPDSPLGEVVKRRLAKRTK
ncbi:DNA-nicking Smr family endonuclease [Bradyrhizobium sp. USDA 4524]|uniref:hypothetical protein n=1 Tax=unclassified Bradyrhizobium TaxID=2631580 RepID=UPI0020A18719|nr:MULTISPECIES: hypothetical protein [unclassified Bradyrhizobium]MCP1841459.1 DNA-nicking Smr family endonuclease [Bradyrhizobium sp. USDA 4538]MCP1902023.1 DNA-nicking Smr family endonuclease [Bradyrhizobium sp. USDA 4537]MCP1992320.1 DNA-nicking Smr family endonuclease [Bradyrhizobium sp. USDA 4539]